MSSEDRITREHDAKSSAKTAVPRLCVVDDDPDLQLFSRDIADIGHFCLVGSFCSAEQALEGLPRKRPDVVLMDVRLPEMSGVECTEKLSTLLPELAIIILTGYPDRSTFFRSLLSGARGFLVKPLSAKEVISAINTVLNGDVALAEEAITYLFEVFHRFRHLRRETGLTQREEEILACIFEGLQDKEIASKLGIGSATVHTHMHRLFEKLGAHSRREIILKYLKLA